jgi:hypothetical protein
VAQDRDEISRPMTGSKVGRRKSCGFSDPLVAITGIKDRAAKVRRIKASSSAMPVIILKSSPAIWDIVP